MQLRSAASSSTPKFENRSVFDDVKTLAGVRDIILPAFWRTEWDLLINLSDRSLTAFDSKSSKVVIVTQADLNGSDRSNRIKVGMSKWRKAAQLKHTYDASGLGNAVVDDVLK